MPRLTKKQQAEKEREGLARQALAREERIRAALRWTGPAPERDVPPPDSGLAGLPLTTGWTFHPYNCRVEVACSSSVHHAVGRIDRTTTQEPLALYSSRLLALRGLRAAKEREFAGVLERIDREIEREEANG